MELRSEGSSSSTEHRPKLPSSPGLHRDGLLALGSWLPGVRGYLSAWQRGLPRATTKSPINEGSRRQDGTPVRAGKAVVAVPAVGPHCAHTGPIVGQGDVLALG